MRKTFAQMTFALGDREFFCPNVAVRSRYIRASKRNPLGRHIVECDGRFRLVPNHPPALESGRIGVPWRFP